MSKHTAERIDALADEQMIFNTVYTHLIKQGGPSISGFVEYNDGKKEPRCRYRGDNGRMCAVGFLIPDAAYREDMEGLAVGGLVDDEFHFGLGHLMPHVALLREMQRAHDHAATTFDESKWADVITRMFRNIAEVYNLDTSVLER